MDGIINVLKPPGMTSFDIIGFLRGMLRTGKIGHAGTLDPGAVGVLPVFIGKGTKAIEFMMEKDKLYRAELTLGIETDTQDSSGTVLEKKPVNVSNDEIRDVVKSFIGKQEQVPPMYSAIKINGKKLYELAREGKTIERNPREIEIYDLNIIKIGQDNRVIFDIACSKGTYIRTLCSDIGKSLGCGGHMSFLIRLEAGNFNISDSVTLEELSDAANEGRVGDYLAKVDRAFMGFDELVLGEKDEKRFLNGCAVGVSGKPLKINDIFRVYNMNYNFIALGKVVNSNGNLMLKSLKVF